VRLTEAVALINGAVESQAAEVWADLGSGGGTFTLALASLLADGSTIHAVDEDASALRRIPARHAGVSIVTHTQNFTSQPWPCGEVDGILMANALHFVREQTAFVRACLPHLRQRRFLIVEYDTERANRWVPYPLSRYAATKIFADVGLTSITDLGSRASIYQRSRIYAVIASAPGQTGNVDFRGSAAYRE
jgi:trans-aconitate methyltransferase